jgi:hypothetical protein
MVIRQIHISDFTDKQITCIDCGNIFTFTAGEQAYFTSKGLCETKRCPACRKYRRVSIVVVDDTGAGESK